MAEAPNRLVRLAVPVVLLLVAGFVIGYALIVNSRSKPAAPANPPAAQAPAPAPGAPPAAVVNPPADGTKPPEQAAAPAQSPAPAPAPAAPGQPLSAKAFPTPANGYAPIGSIVPATEGGKYEMEVRFSLVGAGVESITLANHYEHVDHKNHEVIQVARTSTVDPTTRLVPFAAHLLELNGQQVWLSVNRADPTTCFWREAGPGSFEAIIADKLGADVARITRRYSLKPGSYDLDLEQKIENLTDKPLSATWHQFGPGDLPFIQGGYVTDVRRARFGYLMDPSVDPDRIVQGSRFIIGRQSAMSKPAPADQHGVLSFAEPLWPNETSKKEKYSLVWTGMTGRYFAVTLHRPDVSPPAPGAPKPDVTLSTVDRVDRFGFNGATQPTASDSYMVLRLSTPALSVAPKGTTDVSLGVYAGPISKTFINAEPAAKATGLDTLVIYTFGGPCGFCTFQTVTTLLRGFLGVLHDYVFHDWALSIMTLVVCVRSVLHPITRWSQLRMAHFSKQMQAVGPKIKQIQEKFKDDPQRLRQEQARLMREEHVSYGSAAMGCLPAFCQSPIWIALYAMLFFTFELRHEPAFYGVFQTLSSGKWHFLADLAEPDRFIPLGISINIPFISTTIMRGPIESINIVPLILGVVFFIQQKYLTPPTTATLTPDQQQQQRITKVMMVVMFPLFMYNAPSGLALYFVVNSTLGILEGKWIRSHADAFIAKRNAAAAAKRQWDPKRTVAPEGGLLSRLQKVVEAAQKNRDIAKKLEAKRKKP